MCPARSGKRRVDSSFEVSASGLCRAMAATASAATVTLPRIIRFFGCMGCPLGAGAPLDADEAEDHGRDADEQGHQTDVEHLNRRAEAVDVLVELVLHVAQVAARLHELLAHLLLFLALLGRHE